MTRTQAAYSRPTGTSAAEHLVKKSRFVAQAGPARDRAEAMAFIGACAAEHPGARHTCYAFIAGNPHGEPDMGSSDDGEPSGTAGRPILGVLEHHGVGDVVAVVIRYFGGVKLGAGGLVRAYSTSAQQAVEGLPLETWEPVRPLRLAFDFSHESRVRRVAEQQAVALGEPRYGRQVAMEATPVASQADALIDALVEATHGDIRIESVSVD